MMYEFEPEDLNKYGEDFEGNWVDDGVGLADDIEREEDEELRKYIQALYRDKEYYQMIVKKIQHDIKQLESNKYGQGWGF
jgi:hypothetical protein